MHEAITAARTHGTRRSRSTGGGGLMLAAALWLVLAGCSRDEDDAGGTTATSDTGGQVALEPMPPVTGPVFTDITSEAGIDFRHQSGASEHRDLPEIMGGGGGFLDYDGDGLLDIYLVQSGPFGTADALPTSRLYRNLGNCRFRDVTRETGAGVPGYGFGLAAADYEPDGDIDIFVTRYGADVLLRNTGAGTFEDVTEAAGVGDSRWGASAAWFDYDLDGDLDLYVTRYLVYERRPEPCRSSLTQAVDYCNPTVYPAETHLFWRNEGNGAFHDVTKEVGIGTHPGYGLAVCASDFNDDGWTDLYVANDQSPAMLWTNVRGRRFVDEASRRGCARNVEGNAIAGMGIAAADFDCDLDLDLYVTNLRSQAGLFLRNDGSTFRDMSSRWGEMAWLRPYTGFGVACFDCDLDGTLEMFIADGGVSAHFEAYSPGRPYEERNLAVRRTPAGKFVDANRLLPETAREFAVSRGLATGDIDNDGDLDLLICRNDTTPLLLRNDQPFRGHWLVVEPLDAMGRSPMLNTRVVVTAGSTRRLGESRMHHSYLVTCDPRIHFSLGSSPGPVTLSVRWPGETRDDTHGPFPIDQIVKLRKPGVR